MTSTTQASVSITEVRSLSTVPVWTESGPCAARLLGIGRTTAYSAARTGNLPGAVRVGGRVVCSVPVLLRFLGAEPVRDEVW